jgi:hypothetical protein
MISKLLGWSCLASALIFVLLWGYLVFSGYRPPTDPVQRFRMAMAFCSPIMLALMFGAPLLIFNPFD